MPVAATTNSNGIIEKGNIDLGTRPKVKNPDGSISTVRSVGVNVDGKELLLPTVTDDGQIVSTKEAVDIYRKTGKHLGIFDSVEASNSYAQKLHLEQAKGLDSSNVPGNPFIVEENALGNPFAVAPTAAIPEADVSDVVEYFSNNLKKHRETKSVAEQVSRAQSGIVELQAADPGKATEVIPEKLTTRESQNLIEDWKAGWQMSVSGLRSQAPDLRLPEDASMLSTAVSGLATAIGDVPAMIPGAAAGFLGGLATGPLAPVVAPITAFAGAAAAPAGLRKILMDHYEKGDVQDFNDLYQRSMGATLEALKHGTIGALTAGAGGVATKVAGPVISKVVSPTIAKAITPTVTTTARLATEVTTMTTLGAAIEGHFPKAKDFGAAAMMVGTLHGVTSGTAKVASKMRRIFAETGVRPETVAADAQQNPVIMQELLSDDGTIPKAYEPLRDSPPAARVIEDARLKEANIHANEPKLVEILKTKERAEQLEGDVLENVVAANERIKADGDNANTRDILIRNDGNKLLAAISRIKDKLPSEPEVIEHPTTPELAKPFPGHAEESAKAEIKLVEPARKELPRKDNYGTEISAAEEKVLSRITQDEPPTTKTTLPQKWNEIYRQTIEEYRPLYDLTKMLKGEKKLSIMEDPHQMYQVAQSAGLAERFFKKGVEDAQTKKTVTRPLEEIMAPFEKDVRRLNAYRVAARALEVSKQKNKLGKFKKTGVDLEAAELVVKAGEKEFGAVHKELTDFSNKAFRYFAELSGFSEKQIAILEDLHKNYVPFNRLVEGGKEGFGASILSKPIKHQMGSERLIIDPTQSTIRNILELAIVAEKNRVVTAMVNLAKERGGPNGVPGLFEKVPGRAKKITVSDKELEAFAEEHGIDLGSGDDSLPTLSIFRPKAMNLAPNEVPFQVDGKTQIWRTTPEVAALLKGGDYATPSIVEKLLRGPAKSLTVGATSTLEFVTVNNPIMDSLTSWLTEGAAPVYTQLIGLRELFKQGETYQTWLSGGGSMKSAKEIASFAERYQYKDKSFLDYGWNVVRSPIDAIVMAKHFSEMSTRLGVAHKVINELTQNGKIPLTPEMIYETSLRSRRATIDFLRTGAKIRSVNNAISFLSVQLQAMDIPIRFMKDNPKLFSQRMAPITAMTMMNWWANKDDERVRSLKRWQKDHYWIFATDNWVPATDEDNIEDMPDYLKRKMESSVTVDGIEYPAGAIEINKGILFKIKKPEILIPFTSLPERLLESFFTDNPRAFRDFEETMIQAIVPNLIPILPLPAIEQAVDHSFFTGHKLIPAHLERVAPELQYTEYTTESARLLGKMTQHVPLVGETGFASPIIIENYLRAWTGGAGQMMLQIADQALLKSGVIKRPPRAERTWADMPGIKAFVSRFPSAGTQYLDDFFQRYDRVEKKKNSLKLLSQKVGAEEEFETYLSKMKDPDFIQLSGYKKAFGRIREYVTSIHDNPEYAPREKRQLIDGQYYLMLQMAKEAVDLIDETERNFKEIEKEIK